MKYKGIHWILLTLAMMAVMFVATLSTSATPPSNDDIPITRWVSPDDSQPITYTEWQAQQPPPDPLYLEHVFSLKAAPQNAAGVVVALVNPSIYPDIAISLDQWQTDVEGEGWSALINPASFPNPETLRSYLIETPGLEGCLLIGDFPVPWYELDVSGHEEFPIDLYYMDLDGDWIDNDKDGLYDEHTGNTAPEIWVGRLTASPLTLGGNEAMLFNTYFAKNHAYRQGSLQLTSRALNYVDDDWIAFGNKWGVDLSQVCDLTTTINDPEVTRAEDYGERLVDGYTWIQVCAHSWPGGHSFMYNAGQSWDYIYNSDIYNIDPHSFFYNLFACSAARFVEPDYIGGWYIFVDTYGVAAVGSTKMGGMLDFDVFYVPLDQGESLGEAFREWFTQVGINNKYWHYGMTLLGDPTLTSASQCNVPPEITELNVSPSAILENDLITLDVDFSDPGSDEHQLVVSWGDGTSDTYEILFGKRQFIAAHQYLDDDPSGTPSDEITIQVTVSDDDGGSDEASPTVIVSNVVPVVSIDSITDEAGASVGGDIGVGQVGVEVTVVGSFFDVGTQDTHTVLIDWGDSSVEALEEDEGHVVGMHVYETPGLNLVTLTVTDDDGGVGTATAEIEVAEPGDPLGEAVEDLTDLVGDPDLDPKAAAAVQKALDKLQGEKKGKAENGASDLMDKENWNAALEKLKQAVEALKAAETAEPDLELSHIKSLLAVTAKKIVVERIALAESEATKPKELAKIAQANDLVNEGNELLADHDYIGAVESYLAAQLKIQGI